MDADSCQALKLQLGTAQTMLLVHRNLMGTAGKDLQLQLCADRDSQVPDGHAGQALATIWAGEGAQN